MKNKTMKLIVGMLILGVIMINFASAADFSACFGIGDKINFCNPAVPDRTCGDAICKICMSNYNEAGNCFTSGSPNGCNVGGDCTNFGGSATSDETPPIFYVLSPLNTTISKSKKLFLNFSLDEVADVYYKDLNKNTNIWTKVCENCNAGNPSYAKLRSFSEGENNLIFKAVDVVDNPSYTNVKFFVDSTVPRIYTTSPRANEFADGTFEVQFKEANPKKLKLTYGTDKADVNLNNCHESSGKTTCTIDVNLNKYDGQTIQYYFEIEDIAGNTYKSRAVTVSVDTQPPIVNNPSSFFKVNGRYVDFNIDITDNNFYKVTFTKTNDLRAVQTTLCTRLTNGFCIKHQSFSKGTYSLSIQISDKAGHSIALPASFTIN